MGQLEEVAGDVRCFRLEAVEDYQRTRKLLSEVPARPHYGGPPERYPCLATVTVSLLLQTRRADWTFDYNPPAIPHAGYGFWGAMAAYASVTVTKKDPNP